MLQCVPQETAASRRSGEDAPRGDVPSLSIVQPPVTEPEHSIVAHTEADLSPAACQRCGEQLQAGQEWCLECGSARRTGSARRGRDAARTATTIAAAVVLLVGGAAAASYAALTDKPSASVPTAAAAAAVAAAPAPAPAPAPAAAPAAPPTTTATTPKLPSIATTATLPAVPKSPAPTTTATTNTTTTKTTTPKHDGPTEVALGADAASVYDPYKRAADQTDPADSYDGDAKTAFTLSTAPGPATMGIGLDYNLETARAVRQIEIKTTTPGFSVEVYGAKAGRPATILDQGWKHLGDAAAVATKPSDNGAVTVTLAPGHYRHVLLWFTTPPPAGPALAISEVRLLD